VYPRINELVVELNKLVAKLNELQSNLHCPASANDAGIPIDLGVAISKVIDC